MSKDNCLIIFVKNPQPGKVKTRLAKSIGDEKALTVYKKLLGITRKSVLDTQADKEVWYSGYIEHNDQFETEYFKKRLQQGDNLGIRMQHAVNNAFQSGYSKIVVIGSDCPEVDSELLEKAFETLNSESVVLGPSKDGGYYLIGFSEMIPEVFEDISWSTPKVLEQTLKVLDKENKSRVLLRVLNDIDTEEDLKQSRFFNA